MRQLKTVEEAARLTHQPARRLRDWCATGQLACERAGRSWQMGDAQLPRVLALAAEPGRLPDGRPAVALALPAAAGSGVTTDVARRLGLSDGELSFARVAIDGIDRALVVWPVTCQPRAVDALAELADELDGEFLDAGGQF